MKYHPQCFVVLYNRDRAQSDKSQKSTTLDTASNTAFADLLSYMQEVLDSNKATPEFQLAELTKLYTSRLNQLENSAPTCIHATDSRIRYSHTSQS